MAGKDTETVGARLPKGYRDKFSSLADKYGVTLGFLLKGFIDDLMNEKIKIEYGRIKTDNKQDLSDYEYEYLGYKEMTRKLREIGYTDETIRITVNKMLEYITTNSEDDWGC